MKHTNEAWTSIHHLVKPSDCGEDLSPFLDRPVAWTAGRLGTGYRRASAAGWFPTCLPAVVNAIEKYVVDTLEVSVGPLLLDDRLATNVDAYVLHFPPGSCADWHVDKLDGAHVRANLVLLAAEEGGIFKLGGGPSFKSRRELDMGAGDAVVFRPDVMEHAVSRVVEGHRYVLSVGVAFNLQFTTALRLETTAEKKKVDLVNHPPHYTQHPSGVECIQVVEHMPFCVGSAIKYLWRAGLKEGASELQDLEKARWYVDREIARRKKKREGTP